MSSGSLVGVCLTPSMDCVPLPASTRKIDLLLKATGDAPIMIRKKWAVNAEQTIGWVISFIRQYLKLAAEDSLVSCCDLYLLLAHCTCARVVSSSTSTSPSLQLLTK